MPVYGTAVLRAGRWLIQKQVSVSWTWHATPLIYLNSAFLNSRLRRRRLYRGHLGSATSELVDRARRFPPALFVELVYQFLAVGLTKMSGLEVH